MGQKIIWKRLEINALTNILYMIGIIYMCKNKVNNKMYIGLTTRNFKIRINQHIKESLNNRYVSYNYKFHAAIRKYCKENFD